MSDVFEIFTFFLQTHRVEHRQVQVLPSALSRTDTANHFRSIFDGLLRVESSLLASESLTNHFRVFRESQILTGCLVAGVPHAELAQLKSVYTIVREKKCLKIKRKKRNL